MKKSEKILRENSKKKIVASPIEYDAKYNYNFIRISNITRKLRPIVLTRAIAHFLNSEFGLKQIIIEDEKIISDIKTKKEYILKEKAKNLIANEYKN